ncbi:hypothetical protein M434DRAFT_33468 [Hypoxylon sp. CO27-5]|nr:hypothetical protein M434DRAFT_33468 [Hypoxylon sp. CO27-5]
MRCSVFLSALSSIAAVFGQSNPPPVLPAVNLITSKVPFQCSPGKSIGISVEPSKITTSLSEVQFQATGHGRTDEFASCDFRVALSYWYYKYRVAISGATIRGHANLTDGVQIYQFNTTAIFRLEHLKNFSPIQPPEITNLSISTMLTELVPTQIGGEGNFDDDFEVAVKPPSKLVWSPCFHGSEGGGAQDSTYFDFIVSASSSDRTGKGTGQLTSGLTVDWNLAWEECTPDWDEMYSWGDVRIDNWQSCLHNVTDVPLVKDTPDLVPLWF